MSELILGAVKAVAGPLKTLVVDRPVEYLRLINSYDDNMVRLLRELEDLFIRKLDIDEKVMEGKPNLEVMTGETVKWLSNFKELIKREELKKLMKEERVAGIMVKIMEYRVLKKLLKDDREIFDIVVDVVKKKCNQKFFFDGEVDAEEDADYKRLAKIALDIIKDIVEEFKTLIKADDIAIAVVKLLDDADLEMLKKDGDEMAKILSKAKGIVWQEAEYNDHDEEELLIPETIEFNKNIIKEKAGIWREQIGSLMDFLDDEMFMKGLPDSTMLGLKVMDAVLSRSSGFEQVKENGEPHRYCGCFIVGFEAYRQRHDMSELAEVMVKDIKSMIYQCPGLVMTHIRPSTAMSIAFNEKLKKRS